MFYIAKFFLFLFPPEFAHWLTLSILNFVYRFKSVDYNYSLHKNLKPPFSYWTNNVGLAAGFDKNAKYLSLWRKLGFGFAEIGTVTLLPQEGHSKPRIWRLPKALLNRMGMPNEGAATIAKRVNAFTRNGRRKEFKTGVSLGKSSGLPFDHAILEFELMVSMFNANYFTFNLSCPSAGDSEKLQNPEFIRKLLAKFWSIQVPIFIKISAGLSDQQLNDIFGEVHFADSEALARRGLVLVNSLPTPSGGISGSISKHSQHALDKYNSYATLVGRRVPVIASGGIINAEEALDRLKFGADLVQLYTGFIHEGPELIKEIVRRS